MCKVFNISRQTYYYRPKEQPCEAELQEAITEEFEHSRKNYGTRKIKIVLARRGVIVSRRKIGRIMASRALKSNYTKAKFRQYNASVNHSPIGNQLNRAFSNREPLEAIITDLTYVRVSAKWHYVCFIIDLFNREIIGHSCGPNKDAQLVKRRFNALVTH